MSVPIVLHASSSVRGSGFINGDSFGGIVSVAELREMASPEWAAKCAQLADTLEGPARAALREATRDSERALERCPPTQPSAVPQKPRGGS